MNESAVTEFVTEVTEVNAIDVALQDLIDNIDDLYNVANQIKNLKEDGTFKYVSKAQRNALLSTMIEKAGIVEDMTKVSYRLLKKIKREKPSEEVVDHLLGASSS